MRNDTKTDGGPAFPTQDNRYTDGMTLRDWFAGMAMQGLLAADVNDRVGFSGIAITAYAQADAMLERRDD